MRRLPRCHHLLERVTTIRSFGSLVAPMAPRESPTDYTSWSTADLIQRVTDLESQLRARNIAHSKATNTAISPSPEKKAKKVAKPFDPSRYSTRLIALKFAYLGGKYNGFEHHSNNTTPLPTIEKELWRALRKTKLIFPTFREGQSEEDVCWDGCEYSKCGRTDRGVSAFGQVVALRVRSSRPQIKVGNEDSDNGGESPMPYCAASGDERMRAEKAKWDPVKDELPYIQLLNRVLPPDIRILAWCPDLPSNFSARFNCKERRYRFFFTNPAYPPDLQPPSRARVEGVLDIEAMQRAAKKLDGLHDFRNFCKVDPSKQISNFQRRIFHASIQPVQPDQEPGAFFDRPPFAADNPVAQADITSRPRLYYFEVRGSAFLWHQVRHMVAIIFLVGQGYEVPEVVDFLLDVEKVPRRPMYEMASDVPLVLWDCVFPDLDKANDSDHESDGAVGGYEDALNWVYIGESHLLSSGSAGAMSKSIVMQDRKYGRMGIMDDLWANWRKRKMDEVLAGALIDVVARQGKTDPERRSSESELPTQISDRVFDGSEIPRTVGTYIPIRDRARMEAPDVLNARYAARKGLDVNRKVNGDAEMDE